MCVIFIVVGLNIIIAYVMWLQTVFYIVLNKSLVIMTNKNWNHLSEMVEIYNFILWLYWYNLISTLLLISPHRHANHACLQKRNQLSDGPILCYFVICKMLSWTKSMMFYLSSTAVYEFTIRFKNTALSRNTCTIILYKPTLLFYYIRPVLHMQL